MNPLVNKVEGNPLSFQAPASVPAKPAPPPGPPPRSNLRARTTSASLKNLQTRIKKFHVAYAKFIDPTTRDPQAYSQIGFLYAKIKTHPKLGKLNPEQRHGIDVEIAAIRQIHSQSLQGSPQVEPAEEPAETQPIAALVVEPAVTVPVPHLDKSTKDRVHQLNDKIRSLSAQLQDLQNPAAKSTPAKLRIISNVSEQLKEQRKEVISTKIEYYQSILTDLNKQLTDLDIIFSKSRAQPLSSVEPELEKSQKEELTQRIKTTQTQIQKLQKKLAQLDKTPPTAPMQEKSKKGLLTHDQLLKTIKTSKAPKHILQTLGLSKKPKPPPPPPPKKTLQKPPVKIAIPLSAPHLALTPEQQTIIDKAPEALEKAKEALHKFNSLQHLFSQVGSPLFSEQLLKMKSGEIPKDIFDMISLFDEATAGQDKSFQKFIQNAAKAFNQTYTEIERIHKTLHQDDKSDAAKKIRKLFEQAENLKVTYDWLTKSSSTAFQKIKDIYVGIKPHLISKIDSSSSLKELTEIRKILQFFDKQDIIEENPLPKLKADRERAEKEADLDFIHQCTKYEQFTPQEKLSYFIQHVSPSFLYRNDHPNQEIDAAINKIIFLKGQQAQFDIDKFDPEKRAALKKQSEDSRHQNVNIDVAFQLEQEKCQKEIQRNAEFLASFLQKDPQNEQEQQQIAALGKFLQDDFVTNHKKIKLEREFNIFTEYTAERTKLKRHKFDQIVQQYGSKCETVKTKIQGQIDALVSEFTPENLTEINQAIAKASQALENPQIDYSLVYDLDQQYTDIGQKANLCAKLIDDIQSQKIWQCDPLILPKLKEMLVAYQMLLPLHESLLLKYRAKLVESVPAFKQSLMVGITSLENALRDRRPLDPPSKDALRNIHKALTLFNGYNISPKDAELTILRDDFYSKINRYQSQFPADDL